MRRMIRDTERLTLRIRLEESRATRTTGILTGMPGYRSGQSRVEEGAIRIAELKEVYKETLEELNRMRDILGPIIDGLEDATERAVMRLRYMKGYSAEEIADAVFMTDRMVYYILSRVEKRFERQYPEKIRAK